MMMNTRVRLRIILNVLQIRAEMGQHCDDLETTSTNTWNEDLFGCAACLRLRLRLRNSEQTNFHGFLFMSEFPQPEQRKNNSHSSLSPHLFPFISFCFVSFCFSFLFFTLFTCRSENSFIQI